MRMRANISDVLTLQRKYDATTTEAMRQRGKVVRAALPADIRKLAGVLSSQIGISQSDLLVEGSDGIGRKAKVPWVRVSCCRRSPSASQGWYVVFLFSEGGTTAYLALAHASTINRDGNFVDREPEEARKPVSWARSLLDEGSVADPRAIPTIKLGHGRLAKAYEATTVLAYEYFADALPSDEELVEDLSSMSSRLGKLYEADRLGLTLFSASPEVMAAEIAAAEISSPLGSQQGFGLDVDERRAVERHAVNLAIDYLKSSGFPCEMLGVTNRTI